ncbi:MAG: alpha/beta hydrolase [Dehalococcoidia bacterium]|nr:alpha/beta hydrolase [Dehalococcoidia bacterium]
MKVRANGITQNYELAGDGDCLVLIHGAGDNLHMWYNQVPALSQRYRVLTYDVRGFGETELPEGAVDMGLLAEDLYQLLRALEIDSAFVLGYSMGGRIGLQFAIDRPEVVRALVLANSGVGIAPPSPEAQERRRRLIGLLEQGDLETVSEQMTATSFSPGLKERDPEKFEAYKSIKLRNDPRAFARLWGALVAASPPDLGRLACPVLVIAGSQDAFTPLEAARATAAAIPGSRLEVLPTGHAAAIEAPQEFNRVVTDFLAGLR